MSSGWLPAPWWCVVLHDGTVWCVTSDEREARAALLAGARLERLWRREETEWRPVP